MAYTFFKGSQQTSDSPWVVGTHGDHFASDEHVCSFLSFFELNNNNNRTINLINIRALLIKMVNGRVLDTLIVIDDILLLPLLLMTKN